MNIDFIETGTFTVRVQKLLDDDALAKLQMELADNPKKGTVMPGCGGLRKIRLQRTRQQKGKRGGLRVIYLHVPTVSRILLLDIYEKGEKQTLTSSEKKQLRQAADLFKADMEKRYK